MIRTAVTTFMLGAAATTAAHAQGMGLRDWAGGYVGAQLGYAYSEFDLNVNSFDTDSVIGGITAGYLWSVGRGWYLGPEFQYDAADISVTDPVTGNSTSFDEIARLKLIAGYEVGPGLLYGSLGYAYAEFEGVGTFFDGDGDSFVVGVGYDWAIDDQWTIGGEYMFHRFEGIGAAGGDVDLNAVYVKAKFRF